MEENESKTEVSDGLKPEDVWKEFKSPNYVACPCPNIDKLPEELCFCGSVKRDTRTILEKLCDLISDRVTSTSVIRLCRHLHEYLHEAGNDGYKVRDLPLVTKVLEFLSENMELVKEYEFLLDRMLDLCEMPPLMEKFSDVLSSCNMVQRYFTTLGYLLGIMRDKEQALKVHKAIHSLLSQRKRRNQAAVKYELCIEAVEKSELPATMVDLLKNSSPAIYPRNLELVFLLSSSSCICAQRMLEADAVMTILVRMDLPYATQSKCSKPPDLLLLGKEYSDEETLLMIDTLWCFLRCVKSNEFTNKEKNYRCPQCSLWGLCYAFKRQTYYSQKRNFNLKIRNEIASIILAISILFRSWNLMSSGIAEAVIKYLIGIESGTASIFSEVIKFGRTNEDLYFAKVLLLIVVQLSEIESCVYLMKEENLISTILQIVNPRLGKSSLTWSRTQFWDLWMYAVNVLAILTPKTPKQFVKHKGSTRLYMLLEWCLTTCANVEIIKSCVKAICTITYCDNEHLLESFKEHGMVTLLMRLISYILQFKKLTMDAQRVITLALITIERLMRKQPFYQEMYGEYSITYVMQLLYRCVYEKPEEFQLDQRLLLAIGSYIWECIVWCPKILEKFILYGAVYIILDIIERMPYYSRCLFLSLLTDICENYFCGPFLCTWRGNNKSTGLMSLLANIWREEEIRIKAMRNEDGTVRDETLPQIGHKQWLDTYCTKLTRDVSPAIEDMIGSARSKIYSICKIIERDQERYELAKERYKTLYVDLSMEDRLTICTIELYFMLKLGQMWVEVAKYIEQVGINLLGLDSQAVFLMTQRYHLWGTLMKERQTKVIESVQREDGIEEICEYAKIRDTYLLQALDAFDELDYIYGTTDKAYRIQKKNKQIQQANKYPISPDTSGEVHYHNTFQDNIMVTAVFDQHQKIWSSIRPETILSQIKFDLPLISPYDSGISNVTESRVSSLSIASSCFAHIEKFTENN